MTEFEWVEGPLEGEAHNLEFHAFDPETFIAGLWLDARHGEWVLDVTLRKGEHEYMPCPAQRVEVGGDKFAWADRELEQFLERLGGG